MKRYAVIIIISVVLYPLLFIFGVALFDVVTNIKTPKQVYLEARSPEIYNFKIDTIYRDRWNHNTLTLKGRSIEDIVTVPAQWEYGIFKVGDSISKKEGSLQVQLFGSNGTDTILSYESINFNDK